MGPHFAVKKEKNNYWLKIKNKKIFLEMIYNY